MPYANKEEKLANSRAWAAAHPLKRKEIALKWYHDNKGRTKAARAAYKRTHKVQTENARRKRMYGLDEVAYSALWNTQEGKCAVCSKFLQATAKSQKPFGDVARIDHCHETNTVRGLLCHNCNILLGMAADSIDVLTKAINYLQKVRFGNTQ